MLDNRRCNWLLVLLVGLSEPRSVNFLRSLVDWGLVDWRLVESRSGRLLNGIGNWWLDWRLDWSLGGCLERLGRHGPSGCVLLGLLGLDVLLEHCGDGADAASLEGFSWTGLRLALAGWRSGPEDILKRRFWLSWWSCLERSLRPGWREGVLLGEGRRHGFALGLGEGRLVLRHELPSHVHLHRRPQALVLAARLQLREPLLLLLHTLLLHAFLRLHIFLLHLFLAFGKPVVRCGFCWGRCTQLTLFLIVLACILLGERRGYGLCAQFSSKNFRQVGY